MNVLEASRLIDRCIALGLWATQTPDLLADQAEAWAEQLKDVPLDFAVAAVTTWEPDRDRFRPIRLNVLWHASQLDAARQATERDPRACQYPKLCSCSHAPYVCHRGWIDSWKQKPLREEKPPAMRCQACWDALNAGREVSGKEPVEYPENSLNPRLLPPEHRWPLLSDLRWNDGTLTPYGEQWLARNPDPYPEGARPNAPAKYEVRPDPKQLASFRRAVTEGRVVV